MLGRRKFSYLLVYINLVLIKVSPYGEGRAQSSQSHIDLIRFKFSRSYYSDQPLFLYEY